jgi:hypothetical protein
METTERPEVYDQLAGALGMPPGTKVIDLAHEALRVIRAQRNHMAGLLWFGNPAATDSFPGLEMEEE